MSDIQIVDARPRRLSRTAAGFDAASAALQLWANSRQKRTEQQQAEQQTAQQEKEWDMAAEKLVPWIGSMPPAQQAEIVSKLAKDNPGLHARVAARLAPVAANPEDEASMAAKFAAAGYDPQTKTFAPLPPEAGAAALMTSNRNALGFGGGYASAGGIVGQTNMSQLAPQDQPPALRTVTNVQPKADVVTREAGATERARISAETQRRGQDMRGLGGKLPKDTTDKAIASLDKQIAAAEKEMRSWSDKAAATYRADQKVADEKNVAALQKKIAGWQKQKDALMSGRAETIPTTAAAQSNKFTPQQESLIQEHMNAPGGPYSRELVISVLRKKGKL